MRGLFVLIFIIFSIVLFGQDEKRLALVIGNANYDKGALKNPVNDALLIARTLDSLNFEVILDTNIEDKSDFIDVVMKFGNIREQYDVAFVYYAGHGIQDPRFWLAPWRTKEKIEFKDTSNKYKSEQNGSIQYQDPINSYPLVPFCSDELKTYFEKSISCK